MGDLTHIIVPKNTTSFHPLWGEHFQFHRDSAMFILFQGLLYVPATRKVFQTSPPEANKMSDGSTLF